MFYFCTLPTLSRNYQINGIILDGIKIKTLEELREHFDMDVILFYFASGRLLSWFDAHYYEIEADRLEKLSESDQNLQEKLCNIIGVDPNVFVEEVALRKKQIEELGRVHIIELRKINE